MSPAQKVVEVHHHHYHDGASAPGHAAPETVQHESKGHGLFGNKTKTNDGVLHKDHHHGTQTTHGRGAALGNGTLSSELGNNHHSGTHGTHGTGTHAGTHTGTHSSTHGHGTHGPTTGSHAAVGSHGTTHGTTAGSHSTGAGSHGTTAPHKPALGEKVMGKIEQKVGEFQRDPELVARGTAREYGQPLPPKSTHSSNVGGVGSGSHHDTTGTHHTTATGNGYGAGLPNDYSNGQQQQYGAPNHGASAHHGLAAASHHGSNAPANY